MSNEAKPNIVFTEMFRGYKIKADGTHTGPSLPFRDGDALQTWIRNWIERFPTLIVTDGGDCTVMKIVDGVMIFPPSDLSKGRLVWDKEKHDWACIPVEASPASEFNAILSEVKSARGSNGRFRHCVECKKPFTDANVKTEAGWRETQISGFCENCFDAIFADDGENVDDGEPHL